MSFKIASAEAIKSVSQRARADHWDRLAAGRLFPAFTEFTPDTSLYDPKQIVVWNVEGQGGQQKFRALYQGENVAEVFNSAWSGKTMDQVVPMSLRRFTMDAAKECATSGCLVYTIISTIDTNENRVDCERLLLPFGRDGSVEQMLGSLQLVSVQGQVRRAKILSNFEMQADMLFSARIRSGFTKAGFGPKQEDAGGIEKRRSSRRNVLRAGRIRFAKQSITCTVRNISATGAAIESANLAETPDTFTLVLEMESAERLCTVVWRKPTQIGVHFS